MDHNNILNTLDIDYHAKIAHDIKSPLNIILSSAAILRMKVDTMPEDDQFLRHYIYYIEQNCQRLLRLVDSLLAPAPDDINVPSLKTQFCDIADFIELTAKDLRPYALHDGVELYFKNNVSGPCNLAFDRDHVERILWNLTSNALKHTSRGGTIFLTLDADDDYVYVGVIDDGCGISPEVLPHIFDLYTTDGRSDESGSPSHGLGLPIARELAELHGGTIFVSSKVGMGARFTFTLSRHLPITEHSSSI